MFWKYFTCSNIVQRSDSFQKLGLTKYIGLQELFDFYQMVSFIKRIVHSIAFALILSSLRKKLVLRNYGVHLGQGQEKVYTPRDNFPK